jgi:FAD/FMN-containing dehydrogenase
MNAPLRDPIVNDVTRLNPVPVFAIARPTTIEEVQKALRETDLAISIGGGHFSMGGQTASPGSLHLDMRAMNRILAFSPVDGTVRVEAGVRWCDLQRFLDPHDYAVRIMQTYANFTVGGALSVNCHGRYVGLGPLVMSVRALRIVLPDASVVDATPTSNAELFYAAVGGYGSVGVIVEAELALARNVRLERVAKKLPLEDYLRHFRENVRDSSRAVFHNADLYAPHFSCVRSVTWVETDRAATRSTRLQPHRRWHPLERYFLWAITETPFGKWRREFLIDPVLYLSRPVHWRNYEAGYDVAELEPPSRKHRTYVLQEYFVPVDRLMPFARRMAEILARHRVNALNVSLRHANADPGTLLAWARGETFAFVLYYKQRTRENAKLRVGVWTRELIDAVIAEGGTYYLPYQPHATPGQFHSAYPRARELFALKAKLDPDYRLRNVLWDKYYAPDHVARRAPALGLPDSDFHAVYGDTRSADAFYRFLQNIYRLYPEDRFHALIVEACARHRDDASIYRYLQEHLKGIKPPLADLTYAVPALVKQKREMVRQTLELMGTRRSVDGHLETGSTGRYVGALRRAMAIGGDVVLLHDVPASNSPVDIVERGGLAKIGRFVPLAGYTPIGAQAVADASLDMATCYIGLHHIAPDRLAPFVASFARVLRPGGRMILRDHDVRTPEMFRFVALAHAVFNAGLGVPWEENAREPRHFAPVEHWVAVASEAGLKDSGRRLKQPNDPTDNVLMMFERG